MFQFIIALVHSVSANGYQIVVSTHQPHSRTDVAVANIQGKLSGHGMEDKLPTVAIVAHYDSYGIAPVSKLLFLLITTTECPI